MGSNENDKVVSVTREFDPETGEIHEIHHLATPKSVERAAKRRAKSGGAFLSVRIEGLMELDEKGFTLAATIIAIEAVRMACLGLGPLRLSRSKATELGLSEMRRRVATKVIKDSDLFIVNSGGRRAPEITPTGRAVKLLRHVNPIKR